VDIVNKYNPVEADDRAKEFWRKRGETRVNGLVSLVSIKYGRK
jgi:hypothetical protein